MNIFDEIEEKLGKLRRNEEQMTSQQRVQYAAALQNLKSKIMVPVNKVADDFLLGSVHILAADAETEGKAVREKAQKFIEEAKSDGVFKDAEAALFSEYKIDAYLERIVPVHNRIWHKAFGPYWAKHTIWDEERKTYRNEVCDAIWGHEFFWVDEHRQWESDNPVSCTIMLPPTMELINKAYEEEVKSYERWLERQNDKK